jgi:Raf kinase inhibitor-like YbhB/YbcL family protein
LLLALAGCGGGRGSGTSLEQGPAVAGFAFTAASAVADGQPIDPRFTCDGDDASPTLEWEGVPEGTAQLALAVEDPDARGGTFTHSLVYGIDPTAHKLAGEEEGWTGYAPLPEGRNDFGDTGYGGPCPPEGEEHRYVFRLLALDFPVELEPGADRAAFDAAVAPHVLAEARLVAPYSRQG